MTTTIATTRLACRGCGTVVSPTPFDPFVFRCPNADRQLEVDHVLAPEPGTEAGEIDYGAGPNPFLRYRRTLFTWHYALAHGLSDETYVEEVERLCDAIARVDGPAVSATPLVRSTPLERELGWEAGGAIWIKDETGNVAGSHKARHLIGLMVYLLIAEHVSRRSGARGLMAARRELAIASCGNAALAAAVVSRAANWPLRAFLPATASAPVLARLRDLGVRAERCERRRGESGDPAYLRFRDAIARGALPFCCQGSDNGLTIDGGATLALEAAEALAGAPVRRMFVQVGGGALASACLQGLARARAAGLLPRLPRLHAVQACGAAPLARAYERVVNGIKPVAPGCRGMQAPLQGGSVIDLRMRYARAHRSEFMWPWEETPRSAAHGILDDETYDWAAVVDGLLRTGGRAEVVEEEEIEAAHAAARRATGIQVSHTGTAGLAGLIHAAGREPAIRSEASLVVFSG